MVTGGGDGFRSAGDGSVKFRCRAWLAGRRLTVIMAVSNAGDGSKLTFRLKTGEIPVSGLAGLSTVVTLVAVGFGRVGVALT